MCKPANFLKSQFHSQLASCPWIPQFPPFSVYIGSSNWLSFQILIPGQSLSLFYSSFGFWGILCYIFGSTFFGCVRIIGSCLVRNQTLAHLCWHCQHWVAMRLTDGDWFSLPYLEMPGLKPKIFCTEARSPPLSHSKFHNLVFCKVHLARVFRSGIHFPFRDWSYLKCSSK